ncbi:MAG: CocE/NonD family hydrolase [Acidobacteriota bacterium]
MGTRSFPGSARLLLLALSAVLGFSASGPVRAADAPLLDVDLIWGAKIPMRDGVHLNATIYRPHGQSEGLPVIFTLTPYIADSYHERAMFFARNGYVYALVDVRGRGSSEGVFDPFAQEDRDGYDVVEWLAKQPWATAKVAMWGGSYAGFDQWATAKELPPHLSTIVPAASAHPGVDFPFDDNVFYPYDVQWLTFTSGKTGNAKLFGESSFWFAKFKELYLSGRPFADLDEIVGNPLPVFDRWLAHPHPDAFWDAMVPSPDQFAKISIPILTITGHYDGDQQGAFAFYRDHMKYGNTAAKASHYLIVGPWDHAGTRTPNPKFGGLEFGPGSVLDLNGLHKEWYDWTMKGGPRPKFLEKRVAWYTPPGDGWRYADSIDEIAKETRTLHLDSDGKPGAAADAFHAGRLSADPAAKAGADTYVYDPKDTRAATWQTADDDDFLTDQSGAMRLSGDGLVYVSAPFAQATEITGWPRLVAWIALDAPDVDLAAALYEILPSGKSILLSGAQMRARYRESVRVAKPVKSGLALPYSFDTFTFFSRQIAAGSRLRLVLTSPNAIGQQKNWAGGGEVAKESIKDARTVHVQLLHDRDHPSRLELPIAK